MKKHIRILAILILMLSSNSWAANDYKNEIKGVWNLTSFEIKDAQGGSQAWCEGAHGTIVYHQRHMSVAINCKSNHYKMLFYSGPYQVEGETVVHNVQNCSDFTLKNQVLRRKIEMPDTDHLILVGAIAGGGAGVITWERREGIVKIVE